MIACDELPVRCETQSLDGTLSIALVFCIRVCSYYAARLIDVQLPIRLAPNRKTTLHLLRADPAQTQCHECRSVVHRRVELASPPTHFGAAIPAVMLERRLPSTPLDSPPRTPRLQAQLFSCSVRRVPAVHLSRSSRRREPTRCLTQVVRELHSQPKTSSRSPRSTLRLRRRQLQSRPRFPLQPRVRSRCQMWLLRLLLSRRWPPRRCPSRCHLPLLSCRLINSRLY